MKINYSYLFFHFTSLVNVIYSLHNNYMPKKIIFNRYHGQPENKLKPKHPFSQNYYEQYIKRLNSKNTTIQDKNILDLNEYYNPYNDVNDSFKKKEEPRIKIFINKGMFNNLPFDEFTNPMSNPFNDNEDDNDDNDDSYRSKRNTENLKSKNFEVIKKFPIKFKDIGGYEKIKSEMRQCIDILTNYTKYENYSVRIPKGLILEGPPGNGKTLLAKGLAGEAKCSFIPVSGAEFQEKYVGVGSSRIKELFTLAKKNVPCIIFIDEIDAVGRKRSADGESSSNERDNTLNALLIELDGFKNNSGIFVVGATNRIDLLDIALIRPGRIDKKIFIGLPDSETRHAIINIHIKGKPHDDSVVIKDLVEITNGFSGAQIENVLNEAMLNALRNGNTQFTYNDIDLILNKMIAGWQPNDHQFTSDIIDHIAIHEMGHAIVGLLSLHHSKMNRVIINLSSPKSPGYTIFEGSTSTIYTREALFEHLMILLAGRIAEEAFYGVSVTTGAINDFEEALKLAEKMVIYYGMGRNIIYSSMSDKYKEKIDNEVVRIINEAYVYSDLIIRNCKDLIFETSEILKRDKLLKAENITELINNKYKHVLDMKMK